MSDLTQSIDLLRDLIACPTVSADSNLDMMALLANRLDDTGARVQLLPDDTGTKANLFATLGPDTPTGGIVLSGHTDVVPVTDQPWTSDPFTLTDKNDALYGRGTCDMKGFIACAVTMARHYAQRNLTRPIHFAFTYDEEIGCLGAQVLIDTLRAQDLRPDMAIIGEPTSMRIIEGHKGCCEYTTRFRGREGHGSAPDRGVNAAEYAARYVTKLLDLRDALKSRTPPDSKFDPPWSTINVGRIHGGSAHNVIASKAEVDWEMRPVHWDDATFVKTELALYVDTTLRPAMQAVDPNADITTEIIAEIAGLIPMPENAARDLVAQLTGTNGTDLVAFGTEAGLFQTLGTSVVVCGPGSIDQAHMADEFVTKKQLATCLQMLNGIT